MHIYPFPSEVTQAEHSALQDITKPRPDQVWRTAYMEIKAVWEAALENYRNEPSDYNRGRMNALGDASERLLERWVKA